MSDRTEWLKDGKRLERDFSSSWEKLVMVLSSSSIRDIREEDLLNEMKRLEKLEMESLNATGKRLTHFKV